jgi:hypothetical protein
MRLRALLPLALAVTASLGCNRHRATPADCVAILDRLVELELSESGYRDPVASARWKTDLRGRFAPDLARCAGMTVSNDLVPCLPTAKGAEDLTHRCLR